LSCNARLKLRDYGDLDRRDHEDHMRQPLTDEQISAMPAAQLVAEMQELLPALQRANTGYETVRKQYAVAAGEPMQGRKPGPLLLRYNGLVERPEQDIKQLEIVVDTRYVASAELTSLFGTLSRYHAQELQEVAWEIYRLSGRLLQQIEAAKQALQNGQAPLPSQPSPPEPSELDQNFGAGISLPNGNTALQGASSVQLLPPGGIIPPVRPRG
jgi:hypothetical protein